MLDGNGFVLCSAEASDESERAVFLLADAS